MPSLRPRALPAGFIAPGLPTRAPQPPSGAIWLHEIKHDGFRVIARKEGKRVRLYSRPGNEFYLNSKKRIATKTRKLGPIITEPMITHAAKLVRPCRVLSQNVG